MKLFLLKPGKDKSAWKPWYDKSFGFVIRAETEEEARCIANENGGDEVHYKKSNRTMDAWMDPNQSDCFELEAEGDRGVVLEDFHSA